MIYSNDCKNKLKIIIESVKCPEDIEQEILSYLPVKKKINKSFFYNICFFLERIFINVMIFILKNLYMCVS